MHNALRGEPGLTCEIEYDNKGVRYTQPILKPRGCSEWGNLPYPLRAAPRQRSWREVVIRGSYRSTGVLESKERGCVDARNLQTGVYRFTFTSVFNQPEKDYPITVVGLYG